MCSTVKLLGAVTVTGRACVCAGQIAGAEREEATGSWSETVMIGTAR